MIATPFSSGPATHPFHAALALADLVACAPGHQRGPYQRVLANRDT